MLSKLVTDRRSTVIFDASREMKPEQVQSLFEAARWAPSSNNQQPWRFIYAEKESSNYAALLDCLAEKNREWARNAPLLILTIAQIISDYKDRKNIYAWHDTGMAYSTLVAQATSLGLSVHPMGGFDRQKAIEAALIPEKYEPVIFAAVGYRASHGDFSKELLDRENSVRTRKPLSDIVFENQFGSAGEPAQ